jgi:TfoX/Sxy family transcriptional regulator of competence genes
MMRKALRKRRGVTEKKMFGGYCWLLNGHMIAGVEVGRFMFRVGKAQEAEALARPGATPIVFSGRRMGGLVWVDAESCTGNRLAEWIDLAARFAAGLPPK